jgi:hypothetical protein
VQQKAVRIYQDVALLAFDLLSRIKAGRVEPPCMGFMMSSVISSKRPWIAGQDRDRPRCFKCGTLPHHLVSGRPAGAA